MIEGTGYVEEEFFLEGEATAYEPDGPLAADGQWTVTPGETAPYRTRILVRYPEDPEAFDGTVFVEWFNVTGGIDVDVDFGLGYPAIIDAGSAYVGVSAQAVGVEGGGPAIEIAGAPTVSGAQGVRPRALRRPRPPRGRLLLRHVLPGRPGAAPAGRARRARRLGARARSSPSASRSPPAG